MVNPLDLSGQRILVTGASSGIGRETAILLSRLGARVVATAREPARLDETMKALDGTSHHAYIRDLAQVEELPPWLKTVAAETGPLSGLVHCAGINRARPLKILSSQDLLEVTAINVNAAVMLAKGFRQKDVCAEGGSIVFISSIAALRAQPGLAAYAAGKGALLSLTRTLAVELARDKIRVNCLCPGVVETPEAEHLRGRMTEEAWRKLSEAYPLGFGTPLDVANAIAFFLSKASRWISGTSLILDGGHTA